MTTFSQTAQQAQPQATAILSKAMSLEKRGYTHPSVLRKRIAVIGAIWTIGLVALIASITAIRRGVAASEQEQMLYGFLFLLSAAIFLAATIGQYLALWTAYVYQYVLALTAQSEIIDYQDESIAEAALILASDAEYKRELAVQISRVATNDLAAAQAEKLAAETVVRLAERAKGVAAGLGGAEK